MRGGRLWGLGLAVTALLVTALSPHASASHSQLELISTGPNGGNGAYSVLFAAASADGTRTFFTTNEPLVASDSDNCPVFSPPRPCFDVYQRSGGVTSLLSTGPNGGNGEFDANFKAISDDGARVFFQTFEPLTPADTDNMCEGLSGYGPCADIYERFGGATSLISTGPTRGNGPWRRDLADVSADGTRVLFGATDRLLGTDSDQSEDLYQRAAGGTALVSTGPAGGNGLPDGLFSGASEDGTRVFFRTSEPLVSSDTDGSGDVYERSGGTTTLVSTGPSGGNGSIDSGFEAASADGTKVFFTTAESLVAADNDNVEDTYQRSGGTTTPVSTGTNGNGAAVALFDGSSKDGSRVFFRTRSALASGDTDNALDLYERSGGTTTLVSTGSTGGNGAFDVQFAGASEDGTHVFLTTSEQLVASDIDSRRDVYERSGGSTTLVSTGPNGGNGAIDAYFAAASRDGDRVFFHTSEALTTADTDTYQDVYERYLNSTTLISTGPDGGNGAQSAFYAGSSGDGTRVFFHTGEKLVSGDTDSQLDIYQARAFTGYARPKAATPVQIHMVPAYKPCGSANSAHGSPLTAGACNPPVLESDYLTVGTGDANGQPSKGTGEVILKTICNPTAPGPAPPCSTAGEQGDVAIEVGIDDVRRRSDLMDYTGELQLVMQLRVTDRFNGSSLSDAATVVSAPLNVPVPCTPTSDDTVGSSCNLLTSADAVLAGMVVEGTRAIWQLGQLEVLDGGADGDADTAPNTLYMRQGLFVP